jgi:hypothetical protein
MAMVNAPDIIINNERRYEQALPFGDGNQYNDISGDIIVKHGISDTQCHVLYQRKYAGYNELILGKKVRGRAAPPT